MPGATGLHPSFRTFIFIWAALMVLTGVTVFVSTLELGPFNAVVALVIATIKALLVLLFFMELRYSTALTRVAMVVVVFFLFLLAGLTLSDYLTRGWSSYINPFLR
jgi:cytochrome c oxidase subunit IV